MKKNIIRALDFILISSVLLATNSIEENKNIVNAKEELKREEYNKKLTYENKQRRPVTISESDITIKCKGSSVKDELLVEKNLDIKTNFKTKKRQTQHSITLEKGEKVDISVTSKYIGSEYPDNEVNCDYQVQVDVE